MRLETDRLILRHWEERDFEPLAAILGDAEVRRFYPKALSREEARAQFDFALARQAEEAGPLGELEAAVTADPANHQARFEYAQALHAAGEIEAAIDQLLELFRRDREWNDGAAKTQLITIFDALKPNDPLVAKGRRRLTSMIFA